MAEREVDYLIIGGGHAGYACTQALREAEPDATVLMVSRDPHAPYDRTLVSKGYLAGDASHDDALLGGADWAQESDIELLTKTSVLKLDTDARTAQLSTKDTVTYGAALLATGALVRRLRIEGAQLEGIHYLRVLGNADEVRAEAEAAGDVVVIGGSFIGAEVAATLTAQGKRCHVVLQEDVMLERALGADAGRFVQDVLTDHGVTVHAGAEVEAFVGEERVTGVRLQDGSELSADLVVIGAGVTPDTMLARSAGLALDEDAGGVRVDHALKTSADGVYAAGDVASYESAVHPAGRLRVEHWEVAAAQGRRAAAAMRGAELPDEEVPYFFSDLADWLSYEFLGPALSYDRVERRGDAFYYLDGDTLTGVFSAGGAADLDAARERFGASVDPESLEG